jgi:hypothetical protein
VTPVAPSAPAAPAATAGLGQASVAFSPPDDGGASISSDTVTASGGGSSQSGTTSPIVVTGLTPGQSYTFTVMATNSVGPGQASPASNQVTIPANPTASITSPTANQSIPYGSTLDETFTCTEGTGGPGISSCKDQNGNPSGTAINTTRVGQHTLTVTATSDDTLAGTATVSYTVASASASASAPIVPAETAQPAIRGTAKAGTALSCSDGSWANQPTAFSYQWYRDGTPIVSATSSRYVVRVSDEGTTLTCAVVARNVAGASPPAVSAGLAVPVPQVAKCPGRAGRCRAPGSAS